MATLKVLGRRDENLQKADPGTGRFLTVRTSDALRIDATRDAASETITLDDIKDSQVIEFELDGGIKLWTSVAQYREDFGDDGRPARGAADVLTIPSHLPLNTKTRGIGDWAIKALRFFSIEDFGSKAGEVAAIKLAERLEAKLDPEPGLYHCTQLNGLRPVEDLSADDPLLILLHGTASSTAGSFSGLWQSAEWRELLESNDNHVLAYQHRTLSVSPVQNTIELLQQLPVGAQLQLVSHSRGGLIGELLCRAAIQASEPISQQTIDDLFEGDQYEQERARLAELNALLKEKKPQIQRFVRVACPARGTTLASGRLDRYLSIILNIITAIPAFDNPAIEFVKALLLAFAKERTDPQDLPGLEAMMPESPFIALLNRPGPMVDADLSIIAGDIEGEGIWSRLKVFVTDLYYRGDHDLIVNSDAMYGGMRRSKGLRFVFEQGAEVNHFNYFRNRSSARQVVRGLERKDDELAGFELFSPPTAVSRGESFKTADGPQPVVIVLPGVTGSHLAINDDRIWLDPFSLSAGGLGKIRVDVDVEPQALVGLAYRNIVEHLADSHHVIPFPYDWRRSLIGEADRLAKEIQQRLNHTQQPVRILAHSMGGLLARVMFARHPELWQRLKSRNQFRFVMLGTPNGGSLSIARLLLGFERVINYLALLDFTQDRKDILAIIARYPGLLELLPSEKQLGFFHPLIWQNLRGIKDSDWTVPDEADLLAAAKTWDIIERSPIDPGSMVYIAGQADETAHQIKIDAEQGKITFFATPCGDGRVPWDTGIPSGVSVWYMPGVAHGDLANHPPAFEAIRELLGNGTTNRLPTTKPSTRDLHDSFEMPQEDTVEFFPDERALITAALGTAAHEFQDTEPPISVEVAVGDLAYANHPVMAGHFQGDTIVNAEAAIDRQLNGRLQDRQQLGYYPGVVGTAEVVLQLRQPFKGAVIVGLGQIGHLNYGELSNAVMSGALHYAISMAENQAGDTKHRISAPLSCLLVGAGTGGAPIDAAIAAILRGLLRVNQMLKLSDTFSNRVRVDHIQFVELYQDRAASALRALCATANDSDLRDRFAVDPHLKLLRGRRQNVTSEVANNWWQRLQVLAQEDGTLKYTALTELARAEVELQPTQRNLVDQFIERAVGNVLANQSVAKTLFELLIPNELKNYSQDRRDLILVLNDGSARYPWELLQDREDADGKPMAVQSGVLRQLETDNYRIRPKVPLGDTALVVGDPPSQDEHFVELLGARQEAKLVADILQQHRFQVIPEIHTNNQAIITSLFAQGYRVLHLAGHGVYQYGMKRITGMVLGENTFLTPKEIKQMREVPELVFINCCHLGLIENMLPDERRDRHQLAANLATQLIQMGVRAVIAAGWAVDDQAAATFARVFYERMLNGLPFGAAVSQARKETYENHPAVNTWGAYQCYGDPAYVLVRIKDADAGERTHSFVAPEEIVVALNNIDQQAATASGAQSAAIAKHIKAVHKAIPEDWLELPSITQALARAYAQVEDFEPAVLWYRKAIQSGGDISTVAIEQYANLRCRWAVQQRSNRDARAIIRAAIDDLEQLCGLVGESEERLSLLGSAHKRLALAESLRDRPSATALIRALKDMAKFYDKARTLMYSQGKEPYYPTLNWLVARILVLKLSTKGRKTQAQQAESEAIQHELDQISRRAARSTHHSATFWASIIPIESELLRGLCDDNLDERKETIVSGYLNARQRGAANREFRSIIEHLDFLLDVLKSKKTRAKTQLNALRWIHDQLQDA